MLQQHHMGFAWKRWLYQGKSERNFTCSEGNILQKPWHAVKMVTWSTSRTLGVEQRKHVSFHLVKVKGKWLAWPTALWSCTQHLNTISSDGVQVCRQRERFLAVSASQKSGMKFLDFFCCCLFFKVVPLLSFFISFYVQCLCEYIASSWLAVGCNCASLH